MMASRFNKVVAVGNLEGTPFDFVSEHGGWFGVPLLAIDNDFQKGSRHYVMYRQIFLLLRVRNAQEVRRVWGFVLKGRVAGCAAYYELSLQVLSSSS